MSSRGIGSVQRCVRGRRPAAQPGRRPGVGGGQPARPTRASARPSAGVSARPDQVGAQQLDEQHRSALQQRVQANRTHCTQLDTPHATGCTSVSPASTSDDGKLQPRDCAGLVPLNNSNKLVGTDAHGQDGHRARRPRTCAPRRLAFILGLRGREQAAAPAAARATSRRPASRGTTSRTSRTIMPAMVGTERFQQLCSMEYLHEYFKQVLGGQDRRARRGRHGGQVERRRPEQRLRRQDDGPRSARWPPRWQRGRAGGHRGGRSRASRASIGAAATVLRPCRTSRSRWACDGSDCQQGAGARQLPGRLRARLRALPQGQGHRHASWWSCTARQPAAGLQPGRRGRSPTGRRRSPSRCRATLATRWPSPCSTPGCWRAG